jgi:DNA polymerase-3 subunit gamma/tau
VEMVLLKMIQIEPETRLDEIITKVDLLARRMENRLEKAGAGSPPLQQNDHLNQTSVPPAGQVPGAGTSEQPPVQAPPPMPVPPTYEPDRGQAPPPDIPAYSSGPDTPLQQVQEHQGPATWPQFMDILQHEQPFIFGLFSKGQADTSAPDKVIVTLASCSGFEASRLDTKTKALKELSQKHLGKSIEVSIKNNGGPDDETCRQQYDRQKIEQAAAGHPMVQHAVRLFDADII